MHFQPCESGTNYCTVDTFPSTHGTYSFTYNAREYGIAQVTVVNVVPVEDF